jgi:hypothetical protein
VLFIQNLSFKWLRITVPNFYPQTTIPECLHVIVQISVTLVPTIRQLQGHNEMKDKDRGLFSLSAKTEQDYS